MLKYILLWSSLRGLECWFLEHLPLQQLTCGLGGLLGFPE